MPNLTQNTPVSATSTGAPLPTSFINSRLRRKALLLLNRPGDRPLRNQQKRIIARYHRLESAFRARLSKGAA